MSSVYVYDVIAAYGGPAAFYRDFYIGAMSPLGFTVDKPGGKVVNYNYYDSKALTEAVYDFMLENLRKQVAFGIDRTVGYCLGTGKNADFILRLNEKEKFFDRIIPWSTRVSSCSTSSERNRNTLINTWKRSAPDHSLKFQVMEGIMGNSDTCFALISRLPSSTFPVWSK